MPQNSRFVALPLGFVGGAMDVYCHIEFESLVATQTGNIVLMITSLGQNTEHAFLAKFFSILFFSIGFVSGIFVKKKAKTAYWRIYTILPLWLTCAVIPLLPANTLLWIALLALGTGLLMLTFSDSRIESDNYTIMMTSGNYRKMLQAWYDYFSSQENRSLFKRRAINYALVVLAFIIGALFSLIVSHLYQEKAIWLIFLVLTFIIVFYLNAIIKGHLAISNV